MKFNELDDMLQLKIKKSCRTNQDLNGWIPSANDYVVIKEGKVDAIFSKGLEIDFKDNRVTSVNMF